MTHTKQTVYVPVKVDSEKVIYCEDIGKVEKQEGYFFTPEQLNEYTANIIKQALETAAENMETLLWQNKEDLEIVSNRVAYITKELKIKQSITNTFKETFKKLI